MPGGMRQALPACSVAPTARAGGRRAVSAVTRGRLVSNVDRVHLGGALRGVGGEGAAVRRAASSLVVRADDKPIPKILKKSAGGTKQLLQERKLKPKKALGQNFVIDDNVLAAVVQAAGIQPGDRVLEVGPGTGNLTRHLLRAGAQVRAVEKDDSLSELLMWEFGGVEGFELVHEDILRWDIRQGMKDWVDEHGRCKVVTNLPYNITSDSLKQMLPMGDIFSHLHFMLQEEAARRLVQAPVNSPEYRSISVRAAYYADPSFDFTVDRRHYYPQPHVDSALVTLALKTPEEVTPVTDIESLLWLISKAFSSRRKMMRNNLRPQHDPEAVAAALEAIGADADARAQELRPEQFVQLHNQLYPLQQEAETNA